LQVEYHFNVTSPVFISQEETKVIKFIEPKPLNAFFRFHTKLQEIILQAGLKGVLVKSRRKNSGPNSEPIEIKTCDDLFECLVQKDDLLRTVDINLELRPDYKVVHLFVGD